MKIIEFRDLPEQLKVKELRKHTDKFTDMMPDGAYTDDQAIRICLSGMDGFTYIENRGDYFRAELTQI